MIVATGDRDAYQLASEVTTILQPLCAGEMACIGPAQVRERYGVDPRQVPDFIALRGDASDRIPGAKGIGEKGAASILKRYGSLENAIAAGPLPDPGRKVAPFTGRLRPWTVQRLCPPCRTINRLGTKQLP